MRKLLLIAVLLLLTGRSVAAADDGGVLLVQGFDYYELRDAASIAVRFEIPHLRERPGDFLGRLVELRGQVFALGGANGGGTVFLRPAQNNVLVEIGLTANDRLNQWPFLAEGAKVRVLCKIVRDSGSNQGIVYLVSAVNEVEAQAMEKLRSVQRQLDVEAAKLKNKAPELPQNGGFAPQLASTPLVGVYAEIIREFRSALTPTAAAQMAGWIVRYSKQYGVDPRLVVAMIAQESNFNPLAKSPAGALGLGQLRPSTAKEVGVLNPMDPEQNIRGSIKYLSNQMQRWNSAGRPPGEAMQLALASYNAGASRVAEHNGIPPFTETRRYVRNILRTYRGMAPRVQP